MLMNTSFYQEQLLEVSSPELVKRYNDALENFGLKPTKLTSFHLDGRGWSPEIAFEQNNEYLSHGPASLLAIILSPEQRTFPVYTPLTSFDNDVLQRYFETFSSEIADLTKNVCLCLELDHTPRQYESLADVVAFESVTIKTTAGTFGSGAQEQQTLITKFLDDETAWFDRSLREQIIASSKRHGDLRGRATLPAEFVVKDISSFYIKLFSGVYVISPERGSKYVIVEDKNELPPRQRHFYHLQDKKLLSRLLEDEILALEETYYREHPELLKNKYDALFADALFQLEPDLDVGSLSTLQRKQRLGLYANVLPKVLFDLEGFVSKVTEGAKLRSEDLSSELIVLLLYPHQNLDQAAQNVVWQLLCKIQTSRVQTLDIGHIYKRDTAYFFELYQGWSTKRQQWTQAYLKARDRI
jgi:hypothetical protein